MSVTITLNDTLVVAKIKMMPPNQTHIRPAEGSLLEALQDSPDFPEFDLERWQKEWAAVEREMKTITQAKGYLRKSQRRKA